MENSSCTRAAILGLLLAMKSIIGSHLNGKWDSFLSSTLGESLRDGEFFRIINVIVARLSNGGRVINSFFIHILHALLTICCDTSYAWIDRRG
eukprot:scaffold7556_cov111-Cylindrotheca_fusiformis.AAC.3